MIEQKLSTLQISYPDLGTNICSDGCDLHDISDDKFQCWKCFTFFNKPKSKEFPIIEPCDNALIREILLELGCTSYKINNESYLSKGEKC